MAETVRNLQNEIARTVEADVLERFLRYVGVDTQSDPASTTYPSTAKQRDLGELLVQELKELGLNGQMDQYGYVFAQVPGSAGPTIGLIAHMDTSPDESGANVKPQVVRGYDGGDIQLPGDPRQTIRPSESTVLAEKTGHDIVTTDGTTLLGADDKAGIAEIMAAVAFLVRHPEVEHAPIHVAFTVDEEVGQGVEHLDIERFGADFAYTLDGAEIGRIDDETFSASEVRVCIRGHSVHPGTSKGKMVNSIKLAGRLLERLPADRLSPETTDDREGFVHPVRVAGGTAETVITFIVRDFDGEELRRHEQLLRDLAAEIEREEPRASVEVTVEDSYRNMKEFLQARPRVLDAADEATRRVGLEPERGSIRGGTDGAVLSARGLPTPNLFTGGQEYHSVREWISVQDMALSTAMVVELVKLWAEPDWNAGG